jgi:hypothetical protein
VSDLLPDEDVQYLEGRGFDYEAHVEGGMIVLVIKDFALPAGYQPDRVELLLYLHPQFPQVPPDMFWTSPVVSYTTGARPQATELMQTFLGRSWQRWSRHFTDARWRPDRDSLRSYLRLIRTVLEREVLPLAA